MDREGCTDNVGGIARRTSSTSPRAPDRPVPAASDMDEITYWIYTKRAPCLLKYDDMLKKKEQVQGTSKPKSIQSISDDSNAALPIKKLKLSLLDDVSHSTKEQGNIYFDMSKRQQNNNKTVLSSCNSSDEDFNIKKIHEKPKRKSLLHKNNRTILHKKNTIATSTPKPATNLRRSLRNSRKSLNDTLLDTSFQVLDTSAINGNCNRATHNNIKSMKTPDKHTADRLGCGDAECDKNDCTKIVSDKTKDKLTNINGKFEDLSDVSGFTANYIRSTKMKNGKRIRNQTSSQSLLKQSRRSLQKDKSKLVTTVNRSVNTGLPNNAPLNISTDSSLNCLNVITVENKDKSGQVNRSTSLLKFMDSQSTRRKNSKPKLDLCGKMFNNIDNSFQSQPTNGMSRYPKRQKKCLKDLSGITLDSLPSRQSPRKKKMVSTVTNNNMDRKENPEEKSVTRTRSGRGPALPLRQSDNSVLVHSICTEQVSSTVNVASPQSSHSSPKKNLLKNYENKRESSSSEAKQRKSLNKNGQSQSKDSFREKSGFAACFSDSDDDKPLKPQKFFC